MRLNSLDELFEFLSYEKLKISDLDIRVAASDSGTECSIGADATKSSLHENTATVQDKKTKGSIVNLHGSPSIDIEEGVEDIIYVKDFESIPNSCHVGKLQLLDRELYAGMCTEGDESKIDLLIEYVKDSETVTFKKSFKLAKVTENQEEKIILNIKE